MMVTVRKRRKKVVVRGSKRMPVLGSKRTWSGAIMGPMTGSGVGRGLVGRIVIWMLSQKARGIGHKRAFQYWSQSRMVWLRRQKAMMKAGSL
jgi:hypothetical protein